MDGYMLNQKKELFKKLLRVFEHKSFYKTSKESDYDSLKFIDEYKVIDFFLSLIDSFDVERDLSNSMYILDYEIDRWNNDNPSKKIDKEYLLEKYYILTEGNRAIANPEIAHGNTSRYVIDMNYAEFVVLFSKTTFLYPLFQKGKWEEILVVHNKKLMVELTKEILLGDNKDLHSTIFHNFRNLRDAFLVALKRKISFVSYELWYKNIEYYFNLLLEVSNSEINISDVLITMEKNKRRLLIDFLYRQLTDRERKCKFDDLNFINRLRYVHYELQGENIVEPDKDSNLIAYNPYRYSNLNIFDKIDKINRLYGNFEFDYCYSRLFKEVIFAFAYFKDFFSMRQWEDIMSGEPSNIFVYYFLNYTLYENNRFIEFKSIGIAPLVIDKILSFTSNDYEANNCYLFTDDFKKELIEFYIQYIRDRSPEHFNFIVDFYFHLSRKQVADNNYKGIIKSIKNAIINELQIYSEESEYLNILYERLKNHNIGDNFCYFDFFLNYNNKNNDFAVKYADLIIKKYFDYLDSPGFYGRCYDLQGVENILAAIEILKDKKSFSDKAYIDFIQGLKPFLKGRDIDWNQYFLVSRKLRFHLGILCLFIEKYGMNENITNYVLNIFKDVKIASTTKLRPLSWEEMVQDSFGVNSNNIINNDEILSYHIFNLILKKDNIYTENYVKSIEKDLDYFEVILMNKVFKGKIFIEKMPVNKIQDISLGMGLRSAYFLINNDYSKEAIKYIEYVENILCEKKTGDYWTGQLNLIKCDCFIKIEDYDKAMEAVEAMEYKYDKTFKMATIEYLKGNYSLSKQLFDKHFETRKPSIEAIVNYSAVLISMGYNKEAVEWCEKYIDLYKEDYLLNANLACAYTNIDSIKALYYYNEAKIKKPEYGPAIYGVAENINDIIGKFPELLNFIDELDKKGNLVKAFTETSQKIIKKLNHISIPDYEIRILKDINKTIELVSEKPVNIEKLSENELNDMLYTSLKMSLNHYGYDITRESPQGYASNSSGELDLFIYKSGVDYINVATGENKEWSPEEFKKQIGQLLGYLREYGGFGFTIIFNKGTRLETVLGKRKSILDDYYFEGAEGNKVFEKIGPILDMSCYCDRLRNVLMTRHKNPELDDSYVRLYHYIVNVSREERKELARQVRGKK